VVSIDRPLNTLHFRRFKKFFLKDPGPLKNKKRILADKQLLMGSYWNMGRPGLKTE
jgi:hypothetical protein